MMGPAFSAEPANGFGLERPARSRGAGAWGAPQRRAQSVYFLRHGRVLPAHRELRQPDRLLGQPQGGKRARLEVEAVREAHPGRLERVEGLFARHGGKAVFAGRLFSVSRVLEALVASTSRMHPA